MAMRRSVEHGTLAYFMLCSLCWRSNLVLLRFRNGTVVKIFLDSWRCVCVCVCVCVLVPMPTHCTITCFGFREMRWVWSIFNSRNAWAHHITCGTSICMVYWRKLMLGWLYVWCNCVVWDDDEKGRRWNPVPAHSLLFSKSTKGPPGLTSPSNGRIAINSTICLLNIIYTAEGFGI